MTTKSDLKHITDLTQRLYGCICFNENETPNMELLKDCLHPSAIMINNDGDSPLVFSVEDYIKHFRKHLSDKTLTAFSEIELSHKTDIFGKIAQRFSSYKTVINNSNIKFGINSIQYINIDNHWLINAIIWNNQNDTLIIPEQYRED